MPRKPRLAFDSSAPKEWTTAGSSAARLYRRLLVAVASAHRDIEDARKDKVAVDRLAEATDELRRQAVAITEHLVIASRLPFAKRQAAYVPLRNQVDEVERLSARIATSVAEARGHSNVADGLNDVAQRLDALEAARALAAGELPELERRALRARLGAKLRSRRD